MSLTLNQVRRKPGSVFFITVEIPYFYEEIRQDFLQSFDDVVAYCIAVEKSNTSKRVSFHLHAYLKFSEKFFVDDIRVFLNELYDNNIHFDIQPCRSTKSCLKYISKEDVSCIFNVKLSDLHFNKRVYDWASSIDRFSAVDPFVVEHRFCYRYLQMYYRDFVVSKIPRYCLTAFPYAYANWTLEVVLWWNKRINSQKIKQKQLYLYGPSNVGKSTFIERIIGKSRVNVFQPGVGKFFMQDFNPLVHTVILFEEFEIQYHLVGKLKRLLEGRKDVYSVKCESDKEICFKGPIIFISNDECVHDQALRNRLLFVSAQTPFWEAVQTVLPKEENDANSLDTIEISSSSSSDDETEEGNQECESRCRLRAKRRKNS